MKASAVSLETPAQESARLMRWATYASMSVALTLIAVKLVAWSLSDSMSMMATLMDSTLDALASFFNLIAVRHALTPADKEHRFGHGKAEALSGLGQAAFIAGSAIFLVLQSGRRLLNPSPIEATSLSIAIMVFSILATLLLLAFQRHVIKKTDSTAIKADALHYRTDLLVNCSVIVALWLSSFLWQGIDALIALLIAGYILWSAREIVQQSLNHLMDAELPDDDRENIERITTDHLCVHGIHDLRSRRSGMATFIQLHIELDDDLTLIRAHEISDDVETALKNAYPSAEIIIHADPVSAAAKEPRREF